MAPVTARVLEPSYLPEGYQLRRRVEGVTAGGFGASDNQATLVFTRGWSVEDWNSPLLVFSSPERKWPLTATGGRTGRAANLGVAGVSAMYHDGLWTPGPGDEEQVLGHVVLHWDRSAVHSITLTDGTGVWAVRGPKHRGVSYDELLKVARSLFDS